MDTKQIEYIIKISEENNITHAAEKLFITQSALNQQLLKLEKELGTPLFHRSRTNWRLTEAGEVYVQNAREILNIKKNTYDRIHDIAEHKKGVLKIGITPGRGIDMFSAVYPAFHKDYPDILVEPVEKGVRELQNMISDGQIDISFLTLSPQDRTNDEYIPLLEEEILLVIPKGHPLGAEAAPPGQPFAIMDLSRLIYEPFVLMNKGSTMRSLSDKIFEEAGFKPNILFETRNNVTVLTMIRTNLCCGLIPHYYVRRDFSDMACFSLPDHPHWEVAASYKKGGYLSRPAREFIELAKNYWS
ncbi:MAG: LysR family transcriptional regulator [Lachnospiraceae bacterium]|nr:LysR family transcriptional regulator [Lachnospiraceae bacterium]